MSKQPESMSMTFLRIWLWVVPIAMLAVSGVFGVIAALDGSWGLLAVMVIMGLFAIGLLFAASLSLFQNLSLRNAIRAQEIRQNAA